LKNAHCWPPDNGWIRLNTDGASKGGLYAGCGGVIRGENDAWMCGFSKGLSCCSAYIAKLQRVFEGLKIVPSREIKKLELYVDSSIVVSTITSTKGYHRRFGVFCKTLGSCSIWIGRSKFDTHTMIQRSKCLRRHVDKYGLWMRFFLNIIWSLSCLD